VRLNGSNHPVTVAAQAEDGIDGYRIEAAAGAVTVIGDWQPGGTLFQGRVGDRAVCVQIERDGVGYRLSYRGVACRVLVLSAQAAHLAAQMPEKQAADRSRLMLSPMPGLLVSLAVAEGQAVKAGEELAVVEAMKMENVLRAERDGVVKTLHAAPGDSLRVDQAIMEFE
jgi:propionyl-CoA carboxylase alpha chain